MINHSADSDWKVYRHSNPSWRRACTGFVTFVNSWVPQMISSGPAKGIDGSYMNDSENDLHL